MAENNSSAPLKTAEGVDPRTPADMRVNGGALKLALNVLRRAGKSEVADELEMTAVPTVAAQAPAAVVFAEARECSHCNHVGINDSADGVAACISCEWHGDSPKDDKCPECEAEGTMTASCPKCHHEYRLLADASIAAPALPATEDYSAGDPAEAVHASTYVQPVPDHCDRIVWHGQYIHLPIAQAEVQAEPVAWRWVSLNGKPDGTHCFPMPGPSDGAIRLAAAAINPRTVQYLHDHTAPQAQPADALDRLDAERLRALGIAAGNEDEVFERAMSTFREPNEGESSLDYLRATVDNAMGAAQEGRK